MWLQMTELPHLDKAKEESFITILNNFLKNVCYQQNNDIYVMYLLYIYIGMYLPPT